MQIDPYLLSYPADEQQTDRGNEYKKTQMTLYDAEWQREFL